MDQDSLRVVLRDTARKRDEARADEQYATGLLHGAIMLALDAGIGATEIAAITGLARSRVYQIRESRR